MNLRQTLAKRTKIRINPDSTRVLIRPFVPTDKNRIVKILARVLALNPSEVTEELRSVIKDFAERHLDINDILTRHFELVRPHLMTDLEPTEDQKLLIGSYFTSEYALESAALFNPSIVPHPDQTGIEQGSVRFVMSLRAIGEGHISAITFRSGVITKDCEITIRPPSRFVDTPDQITSATYDKVCFTQKLSEMKVLNRFSQTVMDALGDPFSFPDLESSLRYHLRYSVADEVDAKRTRAEMVWLARSNYTVGFDPSLTLSQRIVFPDSPSEIKGIEDARFVKFTEDDGSTVYYATNTAYDGNSILPQILETSDFLHFSMITLNGQAVQNKGMALFPRRLNGKYAMLSRQDNENIFIMYSDNIHFWHEAEILMKPTYSWEFMQMGNCGSPIETDEGWIVLTHGVGPMRKYCIGAVLLDLDDPSRVIGRLREPLLEPGENEREGYVPNVVYTCGAMAHNGTLVLPYAMADYATGIATVDTRELIERLKKGARD